MFRGAVFFPDTVYFQLHQNQDGGLDMARLDMIFDMTWHDRIYRQEPSDVTFCQITVYTRV